MLRVGLRALGFVAPGEVERRAADRFLTPARRRAPGTREAAKTGQAFQVEFEGLKLAARAHGEGTAVLLVHGWSGAGSDFEALVEPLVSRGHRVVTFDHPAHGASEGRRTNVVQMSRAVRAVAAIAGPLHAVVGHSLGGAATVRAMADGLAASRVVLVAPVAEPVLFVRRAGAMLALDPPRMAGLESEMERRVGPWESVDIPRLATGLSQPALVIHDRSDREVPLSHGERIAQGWPGSRLVTSDGLGHRRILSAPATIAHVTGFIG